MTSLHDDARVIGLVGLGHGVSHFYQLAIPSLFPWLKQEFGVSWTALGAVTTVFFLVSGLFQALAGFAVDRFGTRRMLLGGMLLLSAGSVVAAVAPGYGALMLAAALIGLGNSVFHPADFAVLNNRVSPARLGHAFSVHGLTGNLGYAAAPALMVAIATAAGWRVALACAALVGLGMAALVYANPSVFATSATGRGAQTMTRVEPATRWGWANGTVAAFFLFFVFMTSTGVGIQNFATQVLQMLYEVRPTTAATVLTGYLVAAAVGMAAGGFLATRVQRQELAAAVSLVGAAAMLVLVGSGQAGFAMAATLLCAAGFLMGVVGPVRDMLIRRTASTGTMGRVYGLIYSGIDVGGAIGPALVGFFLDRHQPGLAWTVLAGTLLVAAVIPLVVGARSKSPDGATRATQAS